MTQKPSSSFSPASFSLSVQSGTLGSGAECVFARIQQLAEESHLAAFAIAPARAVRLPWRLPQRPTSGCACPRANPSRRRLIRLSIMRRLTRAEIHLFAELVERGEASHFHARLADRFDGRLAQVLHGAQAEADRLAIRRKAPLAVVHIGRQNRDPHFAAFVDVLDDLGRVAGFRGEQRRHEVDRIVAFRYAVTKAR